MINITASKWANEFTHSCNFSIDKLLPLENHIKWVIYDGCDVVHDFIEC